MKERNRRRSVREICTIPLILMIMLLPGIVIGCSPLRHIKAPAPVFTTLHDSTDTHIKESLDIVPDTTTFHIPAQKSERDTPRDSSHLENDFAESNAWINEDGTLHHDLSTKEQDVDVPFDRADKTKEVTKKERIEVPGPYPEPYPVEVEVPAKLTKWQSFSIVFGRICLLLVLLLVGFWAVKKFILKI